MALNRHLLCLVALAGGITVSAQAAAATTPLAAHSASFTFAQASRGIQGDLPAALRPIASQGVNFIGTFEAPGNLTGYVGEYQGQGLAVYVTEDGEHAVVGNMINAQGADIGAQHVRRLVDEPRYGEAWELLEQSAWFIEGDENAPNVVYTFTDPFCPFCRRMHEALKPYVAEGRLQVRHIMVGIIREASPTIAASILGADQPIDKFLEHMRTYDDGGIIMDGVAMRAGQADLRQNQAIMRELNLSATPATFFKDANGVVQLIQGAPQDAATIEQMLAN